jgi:hypothetical protein
MQDQITVKSALQGGLARSRVALVVARMTPRVVASYAWLETIPVASATGRQAAGAALPDSQLS